MLSHLKKKKLVKEYSYSCQQNCLECPKFGENKSLADLSLVYLFWNQTTYFHNTMWCIFAKLKFIISKSLFQSLTVLFEFWKHHHNANTSEAGKRSDQGNGFSNCNIAASKIQNQIGKNVTGWNGSFKEKTFGNSQLSFS